MYIQARSFKKCQIHREGKKISKHTLISWAGCYIFNPINLYWIVIDLYCPCGSIWAHGVCPSVRLSVCPSVRLSVCLSVCLFTLLTVSSHLICTICTVWHPICTTCSLVLILRWSRIIVDCTIICSNRGQDWSGRCCSCFCIWIEVRWGHTLPLQRLSCHRAISNRTLNR